MQACFLKGNEAELRANTKATPTCDCLSNLIFMSSDNALQARAHVLLKGKEGELRAARAAAAAAPSHAEQLAAAEAAAEAARQERDQVSCSRHQQSILVPDRGSQ